MSELRANRRAVLAGAGLTLAGSTLPQVGMSKDQEAPDVAATIILQDVRFALPADVRKRLAGNGARVMALEADPVRMWRGDKAADLAARHTRLLGVTSWPQFLMVRGLAEESGRRVRYHRLDEASGAIVWLIA